MSEQSEILVKFLTDNLKDGKDFVLSNAPDIIQQYLTFSYYHNLAINILCIIVLILSFVFLKKGLKRKDGYGFCDNIGATYASVSCVCSVFSIIFFISSLNNLITIYFAPKVFLMSEFLRIFQK